MFKALGIITDKDILEIIQYDLNNMNYKLTEWLKPSIEEASHILNQRDALISYLKVLIIRQLKILN